MKYKCIKNLYIDEYDEDGFSTGKWFFVPIGSIWEVDNDTPKIIGSNNTVRLVSESKWIEILKSTLSEHFEKIKMVE